MKTMRKVLSVLLVLAMILSLGAMAASAAEVKDGVITVQKPHVGETYTLYKIFDLTTSESTDPAKPEPNAAYTFTKTAENTAFFDVINNGKDDPAVPYVLTPTTTQNVYNVELKTNLRDNEELAKKKTKEFLKANESVLPFVGRQAATADKNVVFDGLTVGYYYLTSTAGTEVIIKNNHENVEIAEKNEAPTVDKKVDGGTGSASVGDTIHFTVTITAQKGAKNYVLKDTLSEGLTLNEGSVKVYTAYTDEKTNTPLAGENYQVNYKPASGASFEVSFTEEYLNGITGSTPLYVKYSAVLNEKAVVGTDPVTNKAVLDYGDKSTTESTPGSTTTTYTYGFTLSKTDAEDNSLDGAKFKLYREAENKEKQEVALILDKSDQNLHFYRPTVGGEEAVDAIETDNGLAHFKGLALGTYYLEETDAPAGYNKLTHLVKVELVAGKTDGSVVVKVYDENGTEFEEVPGGVVTVVNNAGTLLPSTGGMGTTMFYVLGAVLVLGAAIALVAKRRTREQ